MYKYLELKNRIIASIGDGTWPVGSVLPKETDLVGQFDVSQSTVCNAMRALVAEGYVQRKKNAGTIVVSDRPNSLKTPTNTEIFLVGLTPSQYAHTINWFVSEELYRGILNNARYPVKMMRASEITSQLHGGAGPAVPRTGIFVGRSVATERDGHLMAEASPSEINSLQEQSSVRRGFILSDLDQEILGRNKDLLYVCINQLASKFLPFNSVNNDSAQTAYQSISYLARELGHQKIAVVWGGLLYHQDFMAGCRRAFDAFKLPLNEKLIIDTQGGGEEAGYAAGKKLLKQRKQFTAVCVDTDYKALGLIKALREAGLRVPEDVSVIGADDIPEISENKGLTTVNRAFYETGHEAVKMLEKRLDNPALKPASVTLCGHIVERRTCGKI